MAQVIDNSTARRIFLERQGLSNPPSKAPGILASNNPASAPSSVSGQNTLATLRKQLFDFGQALMGADIHPATAVALTTDLASRHGLAQ